MLGKGVLLISRGRECEVCIQEGVMCETHHVQVLSALHAAVRLLFRKEHIFFGDVSLLTCISTEGYVAQLPSYSDRPQRPARAAATALKAMGERGDMATGTDTEQTRPHFGRGTSQHPG